MTPYYDDGTWMDGHRSASYLADAGHVLDALAVDPVRVLRWLEGLPCQTCGGSGTDACGISDAPCDICGGSGILGRDGVDKLRGFEQVGWRGDGVPFTERSNIANAQPVFARVPVPEPSEGEK